MQTDLLAGAVFCVRRRLIAGALASYYYTRYCAQIKVHFFNNKKHSMLQEVDWWSTGILLYEMLCGLPPFRAIGRAALQNQIVSSKVKYPKFLSSEAQNLLKGLLTRDVAKRLGSGPQGSEAVKRHPFFKVGGWLLGLGQG